MTHQAGAGRADRLKIIVFDDDPTGSQTVHGCPLLLSWDGDTLRRALADPSPLLFLLTDSRALPPEQARSRILELCRTLRPALTEGLAAGWFDRWLLVSRGDSTLRGHFPLETDAIAAELGPFDATLLVPAFLPGGRTTVAGVHRLHGEPVHSTPFARDRLFAYTSSFLPAWVAEKTGGRIAAEQVQRIDRAELEAAAASSAGAEALRRRLAGFAANVCVAVDGERPRQLAALAEAVRELTAPAAAASWGRPRRFLFQSAASLIDALAALPPQPLDAAGLAALRRRGAAGPWPGLVLVGSHVPLADLQLAALLAEPGCGGVRLEVDRVQRVLEGPLPERLMASLEAEWLEGLRAELAAGRTPVLYTSRGERACRHAAERRALGEALAGAMARLAAALAPQLGYLISKGGITSQTLLRQGLGATVVRLEGQLLPGLSLVRLPADSPLAPSLPLLTFPGNLGDADTLRQAWARMEGSAAELPPQRRVESRSGA